MQDTILRHFQLTISLSFSANIIEQGIREHPELSVGMTTEGIEVRSVGNTLTLHETALTEAFNLKAAIEYQLQNCNFALQVSASKRWIFFLCSSLR